MKHVLFALALAATAFACPVAIGQGFPNKPVKILVPFSGSGSEMLGCMNAGWTDVTGIELDPAYVKIALERIANASRQGS